MGECPECGLADPGAVDFCPNPQCRTYLGRASAAASLAVAEHGLPDKTLPVVPEPPGAAGGSQAVQTTPVPAPTAGPPQKRGVRVTIEPAELTVGPGSEVTTAVTVRNIGSRVEEFRLTPRGPAAAFASITPSVLSVYPDVEQRALVSLTPPRSPHSRAGVVPFDVMASSAIHSDVSDFARGQLTITAFEDLSAALTPELSRGRRPGTHQVSLTNGGNTPVSTQLEFRDQDGELIFEPPGGALTLQPGDTADFPVRVNGRRHWFGRTTRSPFTAVVTPASPQSPITLNGTRAQDAVFPWWIPTAALAVIALAIALFALFKPGTPTVPVIGPVDEATAVQQLKDAHYLPDVINLPNNDIAQGFAIKTDPAGGSPLPQGEHVKLYISAGKCQGPCPVEVPSVVGLTLSQAQDILQAAKLNVRVVREPSATVPVDQVISSDPKATTLRPPGDQVALTVSSGPPSTSSAPAPPPPPPPPPPAPVQVPDLTGKAANDAINALTALGLKPTLVTVHSDAAADSQVLSTQPAATSKVEPGSGVTVNIARNTARVDLIATAGQATWRNGSGALPFPGKDGDTNGFVLVKDAAVLEDGTTANVLETSPPASGSITGVYKLAEPVVPGDHVRARVGWLKGATGTVTFVLKANGQLIQQVTATADGKLQDFDADLSAAQGATSIEITVLAGAGSTQNAAVWQDLRLEPQVG